MEEAADLDTFTAEILKKTLIFCAVSLTYTWFSSSYPSVVWKITSLKSRKCRDIFEEYCQNFFLLKKKIICKKLLVNFVEFLVSRICEKQEPVNL